MLDKEKVIYSIERCLCHVPDACRDCNYDNYEYNKCVEKLLLDALELLKEQEPIEPKEVFQDSSYYASCGACGYPMTELTRQHGWPMHDWPPFCSNCGREVKWG